MKTYTFRLKPSQDLLVEIERNVFERRIEAGCILCSVGSLTHATLRLANLEINSDYEGYFEIVSLTGTVSTNGSHLHISISDSEGKTIGGHLLPGCRVYTTVEFVVAVFDNIIYKRELLENDSGYEELVVYDR
jgi:predicted DNA-binding protein with PD1-like motif